MINSSDSLRLTGLDTLSERALRRLVQPWTGELRSIDSLSIEGDGARVADESTFENIVDSWRRSRDAYIDSDAGSVMGQSSSLADGVIQLSDMAQPVSDSLSTNITEVGDVAGGVSNVAIDSFAMSGNVVTEVADNARYAEQLLQGVASFSGSGMLWVDVLLNLFIFGVVLGYMFCVYRYYDDVVALFSSVFSRSVISADRVGERRRSEIFYGFLGKLFLLGAAFVGVLAMLSIVGEHTMQVGLTQDVMMAVPLIAVAVFLVVIVFQYIELLIVGVVIRSLPEVFAIMRLRLTYFVFFTVIAAPILLISQMGQAESYEVWGSLGLVATFLSLMLYLRESLQFFISKKISILHWFLYLCTVEILPLTLLWQLVVRI
ncbi:MAG: DUF4271 domain-containing protein [Rikenellaceae bacterium]|nr:DUF4271 domain-containing protein [Rikenellaceae bacterium]